MGKYQSRKDEFIDKTVEQMLVIKDQVCQELKTLNENLKLASTPEMLTQKKELVHKRVRVYERLKKLNYSCAEVRSKKAAEKKPPTPPVA